MEELPETVLSLVLGNSSNTTLNALSRTSQTLTQKISAISEGNYMWQFMTEEYLGVKIPMIHSNWEDVYKFVTLIGDDKYLLYTRDIFYAKLGLLIGVDFKDKHTITKALAKADLDTISLILSLNEDIDDTVFYLETVFKYGRDDVGMLLVYNDIYTSDGPVDYIIMLAIDGGCQESFRILVNKFPDDVWDISSHYVFACSYGLKDVAKEIRDLGDVDEEDLELGQNILQYLRDGIITDELVKQMSHVRIASMIKSGYTLRAYKILNAYDIKEFMLLLLYLGKNKLSTLKGMTKDDINKSEFETLEQVLIDSICIGLNRGTITRFEQMKLYIKKGYIRAHKLLHYIVSDCDCDILIIRRLSKLTSKNELKDIITRALKHGNWQYAEVMLSI
jgi:hypothetical protein